MAKRLELLAFRNRWAWWRRWGGTRWQGTGVVAGRRTVWLQGVRLKHVEITHYWLSHFEGSNSCRCLQWESRCVDLHRKLKWYFVWGGNGASFVEAEIKYQKITSYLKRQLCLFYRATFTAHRVRMTAWSLSCSSPLCLWSMHTLIIRH